MDGNLSLGHDGTGVHCLVGDQVYHHPGVGDLTLLIRLVRPVNGVRPWKGAGQGRVEVDHLVWKVA